MEGVLYVTDQENKKKFVQIDMEKYSEIIEDILDILVIESRKDEESVPMDDVIRELKENGNLDKYV